MVFAAYPCSPPTHPCILEVGVFVVSAIFERKHRDSRFVPVLITKSALVYFLQIMAMASTGFEITMYLAWGFLFAVAWLICFMIFVF